MSERLGKVADGNTVLDFDSEEIKRQTSIMTAVAPIEWKNTKINLIDTPGLFDFAGGVAEGMRAADTALVVVSGKDGVCVGTEKAVEAATKPLINASCMLGAMPKTSPVDFISGPSMVSTPCSFRKL